jgi:DNA-binding protein HU-beta
VNSFTASEFARLRPRAAHAFCAPRASRAPTAQRGILEKLGKACGAPADGAVDVVNDCARRTSAPVPSSLPLRRNPHGQEESNPQGNEEGWQARQASREEGLIEARCRVTIQGFERRFSTEGADRGCSPSLTAPSFVSVDNRFRSLFAVNKSQLVAHVATELRVSRLGAARLVDAVLDGILKGLREEQSVTIAGFGTFEVKLRKARVGRNPHTGEPLKIEAGRRVGFRMGKALRDSV